MARIDRVDCALYQVPLQTTLSDSTHGDVPCFELITVQLQDTDGQRGLGYTYTVGSGGSAIRAMIGDALSPRVVGHDGDEIERIWQDLWWTLHYAGRGGHATSAISAIDVALWDLKARRAGIALWRYFGGYDPRVPVYAGGVDLDFPIARLLEQADRFQEEGFRAIKMKVGKPDLADDIHRVRRMREHLGDRFPLMVDANMKWTVHQSTRAARRLDEFDLTWMEEPTIPDDVAGHMRIASEGGLPLATGENLHTLYEFHAMMAAGGISYPEPDVSNCGGYTVFRKVCALAEAHNLPVTSHGVHDLTVHALAAAPNRTYMEAHGFSLSQFIAEPMQISEGYAVAPERPGHGVELDLEALEFHRIA